MLCFREMQDPNDYSHLFVYQSIDDVIDSSQHLASCTTLLLHRSVLQMPSLASNDERQFYLNSMRLFMIRTVFHSQSHCV